MRVEFRKCLAIVFQILIPQCTAQYKEWKGGDWAADMADVTDEPIGNTNEWVHYLNTLGNEYDEYPRETPEDPFVHFDDSIRGSPDWYPLPPFEDPYLAVIYRKDTRPDFIYNSLFPGEPEPKDTRISPGTACGGALVTNRHVLTSCGCLISLLTTVLGVERPVRRDTSTYDIYDIEGDILPPIYVVRVLRDFQPDFKHQIETDKKKWPPYDLLNCKLYIKDLLYGAYRTYDEVRRITLMNAKSIVVPFSPNITTEFLVFFPKWPPVTISSQTDRNRKARGNLISIGMRLSQPGKHEFFSSISASVTGMKHCKVESFVCNKSRIGIGTTCVCFCPIRRGNHQLSGGVIGWPVVQRGSLAGVTGSIRHPTDGTVLVSTAFPAFTRRIEDYIGADVLRMQNLPPRQYREKILKKNFLIYDYDIYKGKIRTRHLSNAPVSTGTGVGPTAILLPTTTILWIITA